MGYVEGYVYQLIYQPLVLLPLKYNFLRGEKIPAIILCFRKTKFPQMTHVQGFGFQELITGSLKLFSLDASSTQHDCHRGCLPRWGNLVCSNWHHKCPFQYCFPFTLMWTGLQYTITDLPEESLNSLSDIKVLRSITWKKVPLPERGTTNLPLY